VKGYDEIRRIVTSDFGFVDLAAYRLWVREKRATTPLTPERLAALSPDDIDCRAFWRVCDELFGFDPVCNLAIPPTTGKLPYAVVSEMDANRMNLHLATSLGMTAFLDEFSHERVKTLEIGPGFGALRNYIEVRTRHVYIGVDVRPRIPGVIEATADGLIPRDLIARERGSISYVVSSNVFQHLSARQRACYLDDARALLHEGGLLLVNLSVDGPHVAAEARDAAGTAWCDHYGQYTPIPKPAELQRQLSSLFAILYVTQRHDGLFGFVCQRRK
jgi:hypothetical protein